METRKLTDLVSVGKAFVRDFEKLGIRTVEDLKGKNANELFERLQAVTGVRQDTCVYDTFRCAIAQAENPNLPDEQKNWWYWSKVRKSQ